MKEISILSGKGGTGKTSISAAIASFADDAVFCDCDVDAADLHLVFHPEIRERHAFSSGWKVIIDDSRCSECGLCIENCRFDAINLGKAGLPVIDTFQCEGCRLCERLCPEKAISSNENLDNDWYVSESRFGPFLHARMSPGQENSGKLVTTIRKKAREIAIERNAGFIINDGPPGVGCAAISSVTATDLVVIIFEPSLSGLSDGSRLIELVESFQIPVSAIINKSDLNPPVCADIEEFLKVRKIPIVAKIPFDECVIEAMIKGKTLPEYEPYGEISGIIADAWFHISGQQINTVPAGDDKHQS